MPFGGTCGTVGKNKEVADPPRRTRRRMWIRIRAAHSKQAGACQGSAQGFIAFSMWSMAWACSLCGLNRMTSEFLTARTLWPGGQ